MHNENEKKLNEKKDYSDSYKSREVALVSHRTTMMFNQTTLILILLCSPLPEANYIRNNAGPPKNKNKDNMEDDQEEDISHQFVTPEINSNLHFEAHGTMVSTLSYAHLLQRIDLAALKKEVEEMCFKLKISVENMPSRAKTASEDKPTGYGVSDTYFDHLDTTRVDYQNTSETKTHALGKDYVILCNLLNEDLSQLLSIWFPPAGKHYVSNSLDHLIRGRYHKYFTMPPKPNNAPFRIEDTLAQEQPKTQPEERYEQENIQPDRPGLFMGKAAGYIRDKRQLVIGAGIAIGGLIVSGLVALGSYLFSDSTVATFNMDTGPTQHVMEVVQDHESRLSIDHRSITLLNNAINITNFNMKRIADRMDHLENLVQLATIYQVYRDEVYRIIDGLQAVAQHRLSAHLVHMPVVKYYLLKLQERMEQYGYDLGINRPEEVFTLSASYLVYKNMTLDIITHIPAYRREDTLAVYRYVPMPFAIRDKENEVAVLPTLSEQYLALNDDLSVMRILTPDQLEACKKLAGVYYCNNFNFLDRRTTTTCLFNLFMADSKAVRRNCDMEIAPKRDMLMQVAPTNYLYFAAEGQLLTRRCPIRGSNQFMRSAEYITGLRRVNVPAGCKVKTASYEFEGGYSMVTDPMVMKQMFLNVTSLFTPVETMDLLALTDMDLVNQPRGITVKELFSQAEKARASHTFRLTVLSCIGAICLIIVLILCLRGRHFCKRKRSYVPWSRRPNPAEEPEDVEMNEALNEEA